MASATPSLIEHVEPQPLLAQALRVSEALTFIGSSLPPASLKQLTALKDLPYNAQTVQSIQKILDPFCLAMVQINPESRVKVEAGPAKPVLMQEGWTSYLVKVHNQAHISAALVASSPNAGPLFYGSTNAPRMQEKNKLTPGQIDNSFLQMAVYRNKPLQATLSGLELEYAIIQLYTRVRGKREAEIGFNVGQGTQDLGFRNAVSFLFNIRPAVKLVFDVRDDDNTPAMASFIITDNIERFGRSKVKTMRYPWRDFEQDRRALPLDSLPDAGKLRGVYPLPSRRLAAKDEFPDYFFQPQVYRSSGEFVYLPPGEYDVVYTRGPEYLEQYKQITIPENKDSVKISFRLKRWIHMAQLGWYSADHHIHAAGCSHYESPEEGVPPLDMFRQIKGEDLNLGSNLTWGPSWYYQKQYFTGKDNPLSDQHNLLRYDIEVSGFPSSHAGHVVLLNLKEDDYPNTTLIEQWPSWTLPVLQWAKSQGGITAYAHSGWGLEPMQPTNELPNYVMPKMDGIGANEYIVTVTNNVVDYYSLGDTPVPWELNMWYHTLNCGFKTRIGGETDFPCISDERVGQGRTYAKIDGPLSFASVMKAIRSGRSYVSEGASHLIDFKVNNQLAGEGASETNISAGSSLTIQAKAAAMLPEKQDEKGRYIAARPADQFPFWNIERARIGSSRKVAVELICNGQVVAKQEIMADGNWNNIQFTYKPARSAWYALRINSSAHTNPVFVTVDGKPIREKKSAEWCRDALDQCWKTKNPVFRKTEWEAAREAYDKARKIYETIIQEAEREK
ncbi:MAG: CehA/McbA family metallohydrolase [Williamsia sp.]|nr:CehA/McbA family metallohydrolase [Williamsia sp.]